MLDLLPGHDPPLRLVGLCLISPRCPARSLPTGEQFKIRSWTACLDNLVGFFGLPRMFLLAADDDVDLSSARLQSPQLAARAKKKQLCDVAEVKAHAAPVRPAVFARLVPDEVGLVGEAPTLHDLQRFEE